MASQFIIDVNEVNFEYEVIAFSKNKPVLVDFWAEWCHPCKTLSPILEKIVNEANGNLRLAKVNIDQNPNLAMRFNVRSIPTIKAFIEGRVATEFVGAQPEARLREIINNLTPQAWLTWIYPKRRIFCFRRTGKKLNRSCEKYWMKRQIHQPLCWVWQKHC